MAEGARLESVCILTGTQGSNPCLSAYFNINTTITLVPGLCSGTALSLIAEYLPEWYQAGGQPRNQRYNAVGYRARAP